MGICYPVPAIISLPPFLIKIVPFGVMNVYLHLCNAKCKKKKKKKKKTKMGKGKGITKENLMSKRVRKGKLNERKIEEKRKERRTGKNRRLGCTSLFAFSSFRSFPFTLKTFSVRTALTR
ncbi:hypothetical protein POVWA2_010350 [Plasmodium ovale wallikeri]|uniref:Uncharacterized protein n=1 Tax=Plasmodium ovale wallikeri TaxID=864142 RepID=A0A1A8YLZ1_PLAOA|nr:hypothetical protein POVWA2_010350 [Plasmodium ovale wallikeri]